MGALAQTQEGPVFTQALDRRVNGELLPGNNEVLLRLGSMNRKQLARIRYVLQIENLTFKDLELSKTDAKATHNILRVMDDALAAQTNNDAESIAGELADLLRKE